MKVDSRKTSRLDRMICSKSFETQEGREIGRKEAGNSRGFLIMWMGIIEDVFQMEEKEFKDHERLKMCWRKFVSEKEKYFSMDRQLCLGQWLWTSKGLWQPQEIQRGRRRSKKTNETPQGTWLGKA